MRVRSSTFPTLSKEQQKGETMKKMLFVSLDTYRKDNLGKKVDGTPISPFMTGLLGQGTYYDNYFASANWTIPSYASMFTGQPTVSHNFWGVKSYPGQPVDLIFDTLAMAEIRPSLVCVGVLAESDIYQYRADSYFATTYDPHRLDGTIDLVLRRLEQSEFVFFHTFLMHDYMHHYEYVSPRHGMERPYLFLDEERSRIMGRKMRLWRQEHFPLAMDDLAILERMYYNECLLVDRFVETLLSAVLDRFPDLNIIINSDHGECFSQCGKKAFDGYFRRTEHPLWHHSTGFCREQFEVFAIELNGPGGLPGTVNSDLMDHEDIYSMIMARFGLMEHGAGKKTFNLISTSYDRVGFCGVLDGGDVHLYDRNEGFKFLLKDNLYTNGFPEPDQAAIELNRSRLMARSREIQSCAEASEEVKERLKGFGYM
jgi:hypothetical protein